MNRNPRILHIEFNLKTKQGSLLEILSYDKLPEKIRHTFKRSRWTLDPIAPKTDDGTFLTRIYVNVEVFRNSKVVSGNVASTWGTTELLEKMVSSMVMILDRDDKIKEILNQDSDDN